MDLSKFKPSDWLKVGGGGLFCLSGFLSWWKYDAAAFRRVGLDYQFTAGLAWVLFVGVGALTVLRLRGARMPPRLSSHMTMVGATWFGTILAVTRFLSDGYGLPDSPLTRGLGAYVGIVGAAVAVIGAFRGLKETIVPRS